MKSTITNAITALDELIAWIDESDYSDDFDPRLSPEEWEDVVHLSETDPDLAERVSFLRRVPWTQVILPAGQ